MIRTTLLAAALALSANAQYFNYTLTALTAEDFSSTSHQIDFTVSVPGQFSEQGGSDPATCCIPWYLHFAPLRHTPLALLIQYPGPAKPAQRQLATRPANPARTATTRA